MPDAIPLYLSLDSVQGGGRDNGHEDWIPILAFTVVPPPPSHSKPDRFREIKEPSRVDFVAPMDVSFSTLMRAAATGESFGSAILERASNPKGNLTILRLEKVTAANCRSAKDGFTFTLQGLSMKYMAAYLKTQPLDFVTGLQAVL